MINSTFTIWHYKFSIYQTWSSRDLSLGLETSRDPFLQVLVSVLVLNLGVLVLVLVLEPSSLGLGLGLETWDHGDSVFVTHKAWNWDKIENHPLPEKSSVRLPPLLLWNGYLATVVCWCRHTWLEWVTTCCYSWSTCDATISCKFSCCCTVVISL